MKTILAIVLQALLLTAHAQLNWTIVEESKQKKEKLESSDLMSTEFGTFRIETKYLDWGMTKKVTFEKYRDGEAVDKIETNFRSEAHRIDSYIKATVNIGDKIHYLYSSKLKESEDKTGLFIRTFDMQNFTLSEEKKLMEGSLYSKRGTGLSGIYRVDHFKSEGTILISTLSTDNYFSLTKKSETGIYDFFVLDEDLNLVRSFQKKFCEQDEHFDLLEVGSESGKFKMTGVKYYGKINALGYVSGKRKNDLDKPNYEINIYLISQDESFQYSLHDSETFLFTPGIYEVGDHIYFYALGGEKQFKPTSIQLRILNKKDLSELSSVDGYFRFLEENDKRGGLTDQLKLANFRFTAEGAIYLVFEKQHVYSTIFTNGGIVFSNRPTMSYSFEDIVVMRLDRNLHLSWIKRVLKRQYTEREQKRSGHFSWLEGEKLHLVFADENKKRNTFQVTFDQKGSREEKILLNYKKDKIELFPTQCYQKEDNSIYLFAKGREKYAYAELAVE